MVANYLSLVGGTLSGVWNMDNHKVTNVGEPASNNDAATKIWVENNFPTKMQVTGRFTLTGPLNMGDNYIANVNNPTNLQDVATRSYVDTKIAHADYVGYDGATMIGDIDMGGNRLLNMCAKSMWRVILCQVVVRLT